MSGAGNNFNIGENIMFEIFVLSLAAFFTLGMTVFFLSKDNSRDDEITALYYMGGFEFATTGIANIKSHNKLRIDGRTWNFAEILASVIHDAMRDRNISVGELWHTKVGKYTREESIFADPHVKFEFYWEDTGKIHYNSMASVEYWKDNYYFEVMRQKRTFPQFLNTSRHYETDEEFYEGLKKELRPHIDIILDDTFRRIREGTDFPGFQQ